jgi:VanZ family protein
MPLTPHRLMTAVRAAGLLGGLLALVALTGPFRYDDLHLPFPDTVAHGLLFYGLGALMMGALPRSRTSDLAWALAGLGVASEMAQALVGREMSLHDFAGDMAGVALLIGPTWLAQFRTLVRAHPHATFGEIRRMDRRQGRARTAPRLDLARL